ncbi:MAG TPA: sulfatase-like hydrolase/transferase [Pirellulaceae bacterium]
MKYLFFCPTFFCQFGCNSPFSVTSVSSCSIEFRNEPAFITLPAPPLRLCAFAPLREISAAEATKPNIVFILADDFGFGDLACYGHPYAKTPNIDSLASEGTRFTQAYSTGVTCCPARTGLMTSKFPATYHVYPANGGFGDRITITDLLHQAGYHTGHFGKWHIGPDEKNGTYGIDSVNVDNDEKLAARRNATRGRDAHIFDGAISFIKQNKDAPFYVNVWCHISHHPVNPSQATLDRFGPLKLDETKCPAPLREKFALVKQLGGDVNDHFRRYLADVYSMDEDIGRLLKRIDDLGLKDNTIVVFSADQGAAPLRPPVEGAEKNKKGKKAKAAPTKANAGNDTLDIRLNALGSSGDLRGGKHGMFEGGVRVPFIVRWPGHTPAGRTDNQSVTSFIDWLPTLCKITGIKSPTDIDGEDVSEAWLGKTHVHTKPLLWKTSTPNSDLAIRDGQWKLFDPNRRRGGDLELYDVVADPTESKNLAASKPDLVKSLSTKLQAWNKTLPTDYIKTNDRQE